MLQSLFSVLSSGGGSPPALKLRWIKMEFISSSCGGVAESEDPSPQDADGVTEKKLPSGSFLDFRTLNRRITIEEGHFDIQRGGSNGMK